MRKIEFRVWGQVSSEFTYPSDSQDGPFLLLDGNAVIFWDRQIGWTGDSRSFVLQQFTGFRDSVGIDIYEGDIIKFIHLPPFETSKQEVGEVYWDTSDGAWSVKVSGPRAYETFLSGLEADVIGNIFENKDLIK